MTLQEAKAHLRVDCDMDDNLITFLISTARERCEQLTGRSLMPQQWIFAMDCFPRAEFLFERSLRVPLFTSLWWDQANTIQLPRAPVISVDDISYVDTTGTTQTLDPACYQVDLFGEPGRIAPAYGQYWPQTQPGLNAVKIRFSAGYDAPPLAIRQAIYLMTASAYENREDVIVGAGNVQVLPRAAESLLAPFRIMRVGYPGLG